MKGIIVGKIWLGNKTLRNKIKEIFGIEVFDMKDITYDLSAYLA